VQRLPKEQQQSAYSEVRDGYRANVQASLDSVSELIHEAGKRIAYLRIITPKDRFRDSNAQKGSERWVYDEKSGEAVLNRKTVKRDAKGRVVSNWDGSNLDPCSVKTHYGQLKRMGFVNNLHAKGLF